MDGKKPEEHVKMDNNGHVQKTDNGGKKTDGQTAGGQAQNGACIESGADCRPARGQKDGGDAATDRTARALFEDLLPLYGDGLLSEETVRWMERQAGRDPELRRLLDEAGKPLAVPKPDGTADVEKAMRSLRRRLSVLQLILAMLSFGMAIGTSTMGGSFGFILWYAVLGAVLYLFYRDWRLVLLVSFVPIFFWLFGDMVDDWMRQKAERAAAAAGEGGTFGFLASALAGSLVMAGIHALFSFAGMAIVWLARRKLPLTVALSVLLSAAVLLLYDGYNGNPFGRWLAAQKLKAYLAETYPAEQLAVRDGFYNFKSGSYEFRVVAVGSAGEDGKAEEYRFSVRGWVPRVVSDGLRAKRLDERMMERLGAGAAAELRALLEPDLESLKDVRVYLEVLEGELPDEAAWHKDLPAADGLRIDILLDARGLTAEDVREAARRIQSALNEGGYRYESVLINANDFAAGVKDPGPLKYAVSFGPGDDLAKARIRTFNQK